MLSTTRAERCRAAYARGPGIDEPIVWYEGSGTSDRRWLHQDRLGSVIAVSNASGAALSINTYDEYGVPGSSNAGRFQYTGQMWIPEASLYHYKARAYAPGLGRFLQSDPILQAGGMNIYAYVGNDPVNAIDPSGLSCWYTPVREPHPDPNDPDVMVGYGGQRVCDWANTLAGLRDFLVASALDWVGVSLEPRECPREPGRSSSPDYVELQAQAGGVNLPGTSGPPASAGGQVTADRYGRTYGGAAGTLSRRPGSASLMAGWVVATRNPATGTITLGGTPSGEELEAFLAGGATQVLVAPPDGVGGGVTFNGNGLAINAGIATPAVSVSGSNNGPAQNTLGDC